MKLNLKRKNGLAALGPVSAKWSEIEDYLRVDDRLILPVGSQEQHGRHLPIGVDWFIPSELGRLVSKQTGVPVYSPICYGMAWLHSAYPGTVALQPTTLMAVYKDILEQIITHGFKRILLLNGHGGNSNILNSALSEIVRHSPELQVKVFQWWTMESVIQICMERFGEIDSHAGPAETSVMLHFAPASVDMDSATDQRSELLPYFPNPEAIRKLYPDGVMQNRASLADATIGREIVQHCVHELCLELEIGGQKGSWDLSN